MKDEDQELIGKRILHLPNNPNLYSSTITNTSVRGQVPTTLTIFSDSQIILETELYPKAFDNIK